MLLPGTTRAHTHTQLAQCLLEEWLNLGRLVWHINYFSLSSSLPIFFNSSQYLVVWNLSPPTLTFVHFLLGQRPINELQGCERYVANSLPDTGSGTNYSFLPCPVINSHYSIVHFVLKSPVPVLFVCLADSWLWNQVQGDPSIKPTAPPPPFLLLFSPPSTSLFPPLLWRKLVRFQWKRTEYLSLGSLGIELHFLNWNPDNVQYVNFVL